MVRFELGVEDLAWTRFSISPLAETVHSLLAVSDPSYHALQLPWLRSVRPQLDGLDTRLLLALVGPTRGRERFLSGPSRALADFLTPRPTRFAPRFEEELAIVRATPPAVVRRDLLATHAPDPVPDALGAVSRRGSKAVAALRDRICDELERYHEVALSRSWPDMRLVLEADTTYRARRLAVGGARALFADMLLDMLAEPLPTIELARRLKVTPSAVSQHLKVLHATGLVTRARDGRQVLYRRASLGDQLIG